MLPLFCGPPETRKIQGNHVTVWELGSAGSGHEGTEEFAELWEQMANASSGPQKDRGDDGRVGTSSGDIPRVSPGCHGYPHPWVGVPKDAAWNCLVKEADDLGSPQAIGERDDQFWGPWNRTMGCLRSPLWLAGSGCSWASSIMHANHKPPFSSLRSGKSPPNRQVIDHWM